jgi:hypothetical protein
VLKIKGKNDYADIKRNYMKYTVNESGRWLHLKLIQILAPEVVVMVVTAASGPLLISPLIQVNVVECRWLTER